MAKNTYYFNTSDAGPTDPDSVWTNDANAFDGNTGTKAYHSSAGASDLDTGYLKGDGTNAPASGNSISQVRVRTYANRGGSDDPIVAVIYTDGLGESLGSISNTNIGTEGWSDYTTLSTPSGGWTWAKIQTLETKIYSGVWGYDQPAMFKIEIEVTSGNTTDFFQLF